MRAGLEECKRRGWKLAALTNSDRDLIEASEKVIGVPFDALVVASDIGSYKPAHRHWEAFLERTGADPAGHVHVAQSQFHDIVPATELGIPSIWMPGSGRLVVQADRHQRRLLDEPQAVGEAPPEELCVARRHEDAEAHERLAPSRAGR